MKRGLILIIALGVLIILVLVGLYTLGGRKPANVTAVKLEWWGVFDEASSYQSVLAAYKTQHPYVTITYKKFRMEEYEDALIQAWARGSGPDIYALPNSWLHRFEANGFITPMPVSTRMAYYVRSKPLGIREEIKVEYKTVPAITLTDISNQYVSVVKDDVYFKGKIHGLPQSMDSLALFYNKDLLNFALITQPPITWEEFIDEVPKLTLLDATGKITQAGAALGTYTNIPRAFDIISVLMMQNGTTMATEAGKVLFHQTSGVGEAAYQPGGEALRFYTDFASPTKQVYSWDATQSDALEAFIAGKVAFFFGYSYQRDIISSRASRLNWSVSTLPQVDSVKPTHYANYWVQTVAKRSTHANEAWNFIQFLSHPTVVTSYLQSSGRTSALVALINEDLQNRDPLINVFAQQALTAKSWYRGKNPLAAEEAFGDMVTAILGGTLITDSIKDASSKVEQTY